MISHATRYVHLEDGVLATVTTRAASQSIVAMLEHTFPCGTGADMSTAIPYARLATKAVFVADSLAEAREALMRSGCAATCPATGSPTSMSPPSTAAWAGSASQAPALSPFPEC